ncbi:pseudouridine synthase [Aliiglaciecola lipolytica]|uniref:Dual-specificity RNA pseudouridine synthase RluA n=1 Tax=Aliiglaciecola lipolytica E3 TaxID=1127673 RepID=K6XYW5_9ALTE|nr:pseudouridine synthase [Aliiglaciecola lipolytica]GAC16811.1 tRNA pseudouridine32 synthase [Aliiglaciecola lipolytica E3]
MAILNYAPSLYPYFDILYQDEDLLVLNKSSGLLTVPGKALEHKDSLQLRVQRAFPTATIVHRLDMATSGLIVLALNMDSHRKISKSFELRQTAKTYIARVHGKLKDPQGSIDLPLICDWPNRPKQMVDFERGKKALTHWKCLASDEHESLVELTPVTGRSHQLRVHMLSLGHPILGDRLYAHHDALVAANRLQLHAQLLKFNHPQTNQPKTFTCPAPFSFKSEGS